MPEDTDQLSAQQKRSFWEHHLERWRQSGLSQQAYCHKNLLKPHQFYYWRRRILAPQNKISFLPVTLPADPIRNPLAVRIHLSNGCAIELEGRDEPVQLQQLLAMVAAL